MKRLLDINTWIALTVETHPHHLLARGWYQDVTLHAGDLVFCAATEIGFVRLITQAAVMKQCSLLPFTNAEAIAFLANLYNDLAVSREREPPNVRDLWLSFSNVQTASPHKWMDAYLAAFAIGISAEVVTFDRDFPQYQAKGLQVRILQSKPQVET
ncbi:TA system VapC family ribonuclease toxin [Anatilimnocola floriformis]|uniref:TA system VapC family ribonuclease toxin n=1 Tax=Anatilimnocola floriformis TaxID=2948575 RepID=UPI0020C52EB1|nr:TA system VapC family ribonuclease toxin [Anatilimnocola floriformis]